MVPRASKHDLYAWGQKYMSLSVDSQYNLFYVDAGLHGAFDSSHWALLPLDTQHLEQLMDYALSSERRPIEEAYGEASSFTYTFFPLPTMVTSIGRRSLDKLTEPLSETNPPENHYFPFTELPPLRSHIRPHLVVFNLMDKVLAYEKTTGTAVNTSDIFADFFRAHKDGVDNLRYSRALYRIWSQTVPDDFGNRRSRSEPGNGSGSWVGSASLGSKEGGGGDRRQSSRSNNSTQLAGTNSKGGALGRQHADGLDSRCAPEDPADIWDGDEVRLRPFDSVTHIPDGEGDGQDQDEVPSEESDLAFGERVGLWAASIEPGLSPFHDEPVHSPRWP
ncbi:hypothetical protein DXG01_002984 [Tephrocybe rancida]|nr:hypothetical protein DXG01_002984 [Tephrocybe rancida]